MRARPCYKPSFKQCGELRRHKPSLKRCGGLRRRSGEIQASGKMAEISQNPRRHPKSTERSEVRAP